MEQTRVTGARLRIFDTTLRDGEQSPGASMRSDQKLEAASCLDELGVDVIEAGFPAASPGDCEAVRGISRVVQRAEVAALARCVQADIDLAEQALESAGSPVLHVFIATSDIHLKYKLRKERCEILDQVAETVFYAAETGMRVEFSAEDATRSDWDFLVAVCNVAAEAGATTINLPDTVGYCVGDEYGDLFRYVRERTKAGPDIVWSAHCHDDLGLATANTLAAVAAGARQVEVTINGLGERAGNAPLEEVVMALRTRSDALGGIEMGIQAPALVPVSQLISRLTGIDVQRNKAIVGLNAFAHEAGIHQDGVIKERTTYEIMSASDVGWDSNRLVLGKHSGRHALAHRLQQLGYLLDPAMLDRVYAHFVQVADTEKSISDQRLQQIAREATAPAPVGRDLVSMNGRP